MAEMVDTEIISRGVNLVPDFVLLFSLMFIVFIVFSVEQHLFRFLFDHLLFWLWVLLDVIMVTT